MSRMPRKLKKQGKQPIPQANQAKTIPEAFEDLWKAINADPEWLQSRHCIFIGQHPQHIGQDLYWRGHLYTSSGLNIYTSSKRKDEL